jgi:excisionase family DNA binding protein
VVTRVPQKALTVADAARALDVDKKTIYRAVARGELASIRVGRTIRIPTAELEPERSRR